MAHIFLVENKWNILSKASAEVSVRILCCFVSFRIIEYLFLFTSLFEAGVFKFHKISISCISLVFLKKKFDLVCVCVC